MPHPISDTCLMEIAIEPRSREDRENMPKTIDAPMAEDASLGAHTDFESGQTVLTGVGEEHLDTAVTRLIEEFGIDLNVGSPQIEISPLPPCIVDHSRGLSRNFSTSSMVAASK
jgi:translation elongation factor EF-G